ncbi:MAG: tetratricopeptide repeat protein [Myxococcota bacterium]|nr:tetratricopeptide repeat protein [Myxococcota bacterium]
MGDLLHLPLGGRALGLRLPLRRATPAVDHYERGVALEPVDPAAARAAYERAIAGRPDFADAHNNLGRLHHDAREHALAESHYRIAICLCDRVALYWFNLGVVVEDQGRNAEAIASYERALELDPHMADAHYNLARLYELTARRANNELLMRRAVRHLLQFRSLARAQSITR